MQINYPTEWQLGKPRGSIKELPKRGYQVTISDDTGQTTKSFLFRNYDDNKEQTLKEATKWRQEESDQRNLTRNQIRYTDPNTIEVKLTQDKILKTDAKFLDKVELYPLNVKNKKTPKGDKFYAQYQDKKMSASFIGLLGYKNVEFINGDSLDLRSCNLREYGTVEKKIEVDNHTINKQSEYFDMEIDDLPKNVWILGKPTGTVFKRTGENIYTATISKDDGKKVTKTFNPINYNSDDEAKQDAEKWKIETSYKLGLTKNLIRIINDATIEVKLTKDKITKLDKCFIPLIQKINLCTCVSGNGIIYAVASINNKMPVLHDIIMNFDLVDHINHDTLNNTLSNLRIADFSLNNSNRSQKEDSDTITGVRKIKDDYGEAYRARIRMKGREISKSFYVKTYGEERASELATNFRQKILEIDENTETTNLTSEDDEQLIRFTINRIKELVDLYMQHMIFDYKSYIPSVDLSDNERENMHKQYLETNLKRVNNLNKKLINIQKVINDKNKLIYGL